MFERIKKAMSKTQPVPLQNIFGLNPYHSGGLRQEITLDDFYKGVAGVCLQKRANGIAKAVQVVEYEKQEENEVVPKTHWLSMLLHNANPNYSWYQIKLLVSQWLDYGGNAYLYTPPNGLKQPVQIWVLPAIYVKPIAGWVDGKTISHYELQTEKGVNVKLDANYICHIKTLAPSVSWNMNVNMGKGLIKHAAKDAILSYQDILTYLRKFFTREGVPPMILQTERTMSQDQYETFKNRWRENMPNHTISAILENGMKVTPLEAFSKGASQFISSNIDETLKKSIAEAFGVPIGMLESDKFQNKATADTAYYSFWNDTIEPALTLIESEMTRHFKQWDKDIIITHEPFVMRDVEEELRETEFLLKYGIVSRNDIRKQYGYQIVSDGDRLLLPTGVRYVDGDGQESEIIEEAEIIKPTPPEKQLTTKELDESKEAERVAYWKALAKKTEPIEKILETKIVSVFGKLEKEILNNLKADEGKSFKVKAGVSESMELFNEDEWKKNAEVETKETLQQFITRLAQDAIQEIGGKYDEPSFKEIIDNSTKSSSEKIKESINTIHKDLKDQIRDIISNNVLDSEAKLLSKITEMTKEKFSQVYTESRAAAIARTTTTFATTSSQKQVWEKEGWSHEWISQRDKNVRKTHRQADGTEPDAEGYYYVGTAKGKHPADMDEAGESVNCRCYLKSKRKINDNI